MKHISLNLLPVHTQQNVKKISVFIYMLITIIIFKYVKKTINATIISLYQSVTKQPKPLDTPVSSVQQIIKLTTANCSRI